MSKARVKYIIVITLIILLGLISRRIPFIPLFIGDILWAMMIFYIVRFLFVKTNLKKVVITSLLICYLIEFSQLYQAQWIIDIRSTLIGSLILGHGFLWSDILSYTVGIFIGLYVELKTSRV